MSILKIRVGDGSGANDFIDIPAIVGPTGMPGKDGVDGTPGTDGQPGADGKSAYQIWLDAGNTGTEADFLASLVGPQGPEGKPGEDGKTPDLSGVVKFVNNIGPDDNGNVEIEHEGFKVYRVKDGVSNSQYSSSRYSYILTDECLSTIQTMIANYLKGERNGILVIDTTNILYLSDNLCFIINESKSTSSKIVFQSLITPTAKLSVSGNATTGVNTLRESFYGMDVTWENDTIGTYTCYKSNTNVQGGSFATPTTVTSTNLTISGLHTYNKLPQSSVEPTDAKDLVNKAYVDSLGGETPDLSGYVQTVNNIAPDGEGNVDIELPIKVIDSDFLNSIDYYKNNNKLNISSIFEYGGMGLYSVQEPFILEGIPDTNINKNSIVYIMRSNYAITIPTDRSIIIFIVNGGMYTLDMTHKYMTKLINMNYLPTNNFDAYTPTSNYHPATKIYVDNAVTTALGDIESLLSEV